MLPEIASSERAFPWLNANGTMAPVAAPSAHPIHVRGPDGALVEFPAGTSRAEMERALRAHYGGPTSAPAHPPATPPRTGMFDDLIPATPPQAVQSVPPSGMPPLPPGFVLDAPAKQADPRDQFADAPQADPWAAFKDAPPQPAATPKFVPVDHNPFAQPKANTAIPALPPGFVIDTPPAAPGLPPGFVIDAPRAPVIPPLPPGFVLDTPPAPRLVPVDHDPFAVSAQPHVVPGNGEPTRITVRPEAQRLPSAVRSLAVGAQGVGAGVRDIALMPFDLAAGAQNLVMSGVNKLFGTEIPMATPASQMAEKATAPFSIPESEMSPSEKLGYNINRFGTQGLGMGSMLMTRAPAVAEAVMSAPTATGRFLDTMARPYTAAPARTVTGDAISGMGSGVGVNAAQDYVPQDPTSTTGKILKGAADFAAPLLGGVGASTAQGAAEGIGGLIRNLAARKFNSAPPEIPVNPRTKAPYNAADVDRAAVQLQAGAVGGPRAVAQDIRENAAELTNPKRPGETPVDASALPTSGLLSRDPGLVTLEGGARSKGAPTFVQRDQNVKEGAAQRVKNLRDPEADLGAVLRRAGEARNERLAPSEAAVQARAQESAVRDAARQEQGAEFGAVANSQARANASRRLDSAIVDNNYVPARAEKNRLFDQAPGRNEMLPADDVLAAVDRVRASINRLGPAAEQLPAEFVQRLDRLRPQTDPVTGANIGGPGMALGGDLADLRRYMNVAEQKAQNSGNFDLADNIRTLRGAINSTIETAPGYAEANANYSQFANRFRPERNDEMAQFTRELDRSGNTDGMPNRGSTPPSETAGRFLSSPEKSAALQRALNGAPSAEAGQAAARDYMRSDFAMSALNPDGTLNLARASAWSRNNADVLAQFPALRTEFDGIVRSAQRGDQLSAEAKSALENARRTHRATEADIDRSAAGTLLREDPRDVANGLLSGGYSSGKKLDEINALVKNDEAAKRGWKAAVSEVLADRVQGSRAIGETPEIQFARLAKEFKNNEALLAKTFSPDEMNGLRQAHKILEYFKEAEKRATVGSNTADKWNVPGWAQLIVRHAYGDIKGGGIVKRFKLLLELLPTNKQSADEIVHMAWFNPDVAAYLLERPIKNPNVPQYNVNLRRLIAADNAARGSGSK